MASKVEFCKTCNGQKRIKTMQKGKVVTIICRDCKGSGYQSS